MKKRIGIVVALVIVAALLRRFGPALRDRAMAKCQEMFDRGRKNLPSKQSFQDSEEIGELDTRISRHLERQDVTPALADAT